MPEQAGAPTTLSAAQSDFAAQAAAFGLPASSVQTIDDAPAIVLPSQGSGATINMFLNGLVFVITGPASMSSGDLVAIADTLS